MTDAAWNYKFNSAPGAVFFSFFLSNISHVMPNDRATYKKKHRAYFPEKQKIMVVYFNTFFLNLQLFVYPTFWLPNFLVMFWGSNARINFFITCPRMGGVAYQINGFCLRWIRLPMLLIFLLLTSTYGRIRKEKILVLILMPHLNVPKSVRTLSCIM